MAKEDMSNEAEAELLLTWWQRAGRRRHAWRWGIALALMLLGFSTWLVVWQDTHKPYLPEEALPPLRASSSDASPWFRDAALFSPLSEARAGSWRASYDEPRQSFKRYAYEQTSLPDVQHDIFYILPIGAFPDRSRLDLQALANGCELYLGIPTRILPAWTPEPDQVTRREFDGHTQWLTDDLMGELEARRPDDAYGVLGVTMTDIWPGEGWNFVFGQGSAAERVGVQSFARYDPAFSDEPVSSEAERAQIVFRRAFKVMTHEAGHMFGIRHCVDHACNMNGGNHMAEMDAQPLHLCPNCLRKLHHATRFEPGARYQALAAFYAAHGLDEEASWVERRLAQVREVSTEEAQ